MRKKRVANVVGLSLSIFVIVLPTQAQDGKIISASDCRLVDDQGGELDRSEGRVRPFVGTSGIDVLCPLIRDVTDGDLQSLDVVVSDVDATSEVVCTSFVANVSGSEVDFSTQGTGDLFADGSTTLALGGCPDCSSGADSTYYVRCSIESGAGQHINHIRYVEN